MAHADELTERALDTTLPEDIKEALLEGQSGDWLLAGGRVQVKRDEWPTGRGYEIHFIITENKA
jgi:hypothetical protein